MPNHHDDPTNVGPEPKASFQHFSNALAAHVLASATHAADVRVRLEEMQTSVGLTVRTAARDWNRAHDILHVLPLELRAICWSYLPLLDIVRLALVCSSWRDLSRGLPALWTVLHVSGDARNIDAVLALSDPLKLDLSVMVVQPADLVYIDGCLSRQAHRLRSLRVYENDRKSSGPEDNTELFRYPAPVLEAFSLDIRERPRRPFIIDAEMFGKCAPALRSVTLYDCYFPTSCPAFARVTELKLTCRPGAFDRIDIGNLFVVAPSLTKLELINILAHPDLPAIPASSRLVDVTIVGGYDFPFAHFVDRGYLGLHSLTVHVHESSGLLSAALEHHPVSFDAMLCIRANGDVTVGLLRADGAIVNFVSRDVASMRVPELLDARGTAQHIRALVLPSGSQNDIGLLGNDGSWIHMYLSDNRELPAVRTLILAFAPGPADRCALFTPYVVRRKIVAPALERISVFREQEGNEGGGPALVNPDHLGEFIRKHVICDAPQALELFIDSHSGVELGADSEAVDCLRRSVGNLVL